MSQDAIVDGLALHRSELQPSLVAGPGTSTVVGAFEVGRIFNGGSSAVGWATSTDGGQSWSHGLLPLTVQSGQATTGVGPLWRAADPQVAYDTKHAKWLITATGLGSTGATLGLFAGSSADGLSWSAPVVAHAAGSGDIPENGSVACDNRSASQGYGTCYLAYDNTGSVTPNQVLVTKSTDGGAIWSAPVATLDASVGTGTVMLVEPPPPGAAPGTVCGRVVVAFVNGATVNSVFSSDCGASFGAHSVVTSTLAAQHTVAQGLRTSLVLSGSSDGAGALYLVWQTRSFRITQTSLVAAASAGDTNIKVSSTAGMVAGNTLTVDPVGADPETVTIVTVGTGGAGGTGVTLTPALAFAHASGAVVTVNGVPSTSTAAPNDIALSKMPAPTDANPAPSFGVPFRIPIESDAGASSNTADHFIPAIAADLNTSGATARLALFYYFYPLANCAFVASPANQCSPQVGYVSSIDGGATWSAPHSLSSGPPSLAVLPRTGSGAGGAPDVGNVMGAAVMVSGLDAGKAFGLFPVASAVNGIDVSMYVPTGGETITG